MDRQPYQAPTFSLSVPRVGGDGPLPPLPEPVEIECSPRRRGWTDPADPLGLGLVVFPAQAGMDRGSPPSTTESACVPRAGGDGPSATRTRSTGLWCSPRRRGWTVQARLERQAVDVFPAQAGMDRRWRRLRSSSACVPRAGGDGPSGCAGTISPHRCSPRRRGWTVQRAQAVWVCIVFPAQAGMDRCTPSATRTCRRVPRAGGDGPLSTSISIRIPPCSPRRRGWTVRLAGVDRDGGVFPAQAGMDRSCSLESATPAGVPRAGGDGPFAMSRLPFSVTCSPRRRGWTEHLIGRELLGAVFPALAGMDRPGTRRGVS